MNNSCLDKDLKAFMELYPKFELFDRPDKRFDIIAGEIDVCDKEGNYWESFNIKILLDKDNYPYCIPEVFETSILIDRNIDWHINKEGNCCLDIPHELEYLSKRGINLIKFFQSKIYPFFANVEHKKMVLDYANGEYLHHFDGVMQFYKEKLQLTDFSKIILILESVIINNIPGRNELCLCGKNLKIKNCHLNSIDFLKSLSKERILKDLEGFKSLT